MTFVMEKFLNMKIGKSSGKCDESWDSTPKFYQLLPFFGITKKLSIFSYCFGKMSLM